MWSTVCDGCSLGGDTHFTGKPRWDVSLDGNGVLVDDDGNGRALGGSRRREPDAFHSLNVDKDEPLYVRIGECST